MFAAETNGRGRALARKIVTTGGTSVVAFLAANMISVGAVFQVATSIFVGGVVFVVLFLTEVDHRLHQVELAQQRHADSTEQLITQGFAKVSEATALFGRAEASKLSPDEVIQLVRHSIELGTKASPLVFSFAQTEISRLSELLKELSAGSEVVYEGEDRDWMLGLTANTTTSIDAISLTTVDAGVDGGLWMADLGQRYLRLQQRSVARGVKIRRIFVTHRPVLPEQMKDFVEVCEMHQKMGIDVRRLDAVDAPGTHANDMFDFIVFDKVISYESTPVSVSTRTHQPIIIINTRLVQHPNRVKDRIQRFDELWEVAKPIES